MNKKIRVKIHAKVRKHLSGTVDRPRLAVFRSNQHIIAQIIDDTKSVTLAYVGDQKMSGTKLQKAYNVGKAIAEIALKHKITAIVFDRGGFLYKGRVAEVGKGAREGGLKF